MTERQPSLTDEDRRDAEVALDVAGAPSLDEVMAVRSELWEQRDRSVRWKLWVPDTDKVAEGHDVDAAASYAAMQVQLDAWFPAAAGASMLAVRLHDDG